MHGKGSITFGGAGFGGIVADITMDDGHRYHFTGYVGEIGSPTGGYGLDFEGDFPGLDHILGSCAVQVASANIGPGGAEVTWFDLHGSIGTVIGYVFGGGFAIGIGGGSWTDVGHQGKPKAAVSHPSKPKKKN
jgi:hypothetical protein